MSGWPTGSWVLGQGRRINSEIILFVHREIKFRHNFCGLQTSVIICGHTSNDTNNYPTDNSLILWKVFAKVRNKTHGNILVEGAENICKVQTASRRGATYM